jgi:biotin operon repressor
MDSAGRDGLGWAGVMGFLMRHPSPKEAVPMAKSSQSRIGSVKERLSPLLATSFTPVPTAFVEHYGRARSKGGLGISTGEAMVLIQLMNFKRGELMPYPSIGSIAVRMGLSETAVRKHIRSLAKQKLLVQKLRTGKPSIYDLSPLFRQLERIQDQARSRKAKTEAVATAELMPSQP